MDIERYRQYLAEHDPFVNDLLGLEVREYRAGFVKLAMRITPSMVNSFGITHGGVIFTLADTACAMAVNSFGQASPALSASINFIAATHPDDVLIAESEIIHHGRGTNAVLVRVLRESDSKVVATFQGSTYTLDVDLSKAMDASAAK